MRCEGCDIKLKRGQSWCSDTCSIEFYGRQYEARVKAQRYWLAREENARIDEANRVVAALAQARNLQHDHHEMELRQERERIEQNRATRTLEREFEEGQGWKVFLLRDFLTRLSVRFMRNYNEPELSP